MIAKTTNVSCTKSVAIPLISFPEQRQSCTVIIYACIYAGTDYLCITYLILFVSITLLTHPNWMLLEVLQRQEKSMEHQPYHSLHRARPFFSVFSLILVKWKTDGHSGLLYNTFKGKEKKSRVHDYAGRVWVMHSGHNVERNCCGCHTVCAPLQIAVGVIMFPVCKPRSTTHLWVVGSSCIIL